jgi:hypothetical protein
MPAGPSDEAASPRAWRAFATDTAHELQERLRHHLSEREREQVARRLRAVIDGALEVPPDLPQHIARSVARLRELSPDADPVALAWERTRTRARRTAAIGAVTTIPAMVPGLGSAMAALGLVADWRFVAQQQRDLVLEIATLLGAPMEDPTRQVRSLFLASAASAFGASAAGEAVSRGLARQIARRTVARLVPGAGGIVVGALNYITTAALGRAALAHYARQTGFAVEGIVPHQVHPAMPWLRNAVIQAFEARGGPPSRTVFSQADLATIAELPRSNRDELLDLAASSMSTGGGSDAERLLLDQIAAVLELESTEVEAALGSAQRSAASARARLRRVIGRAGEAGGRASKRLWQRASRLARRRRPRRRRPPPPDAAPPVS